MAIGPNVVDDCEGMTEEVVYLKQVIDELKALCVRADARMDYVKHKYKIFEGGEISAS